MNKIETFGYRGSTSILSELILTVGKKDIPLVTKSEKEKAYNFRFLFEIVEDSLTFTDDLLGKPVYEQKLDIENNNTSNISLSSKDRLIDFKLENIINTGNYTVNISIYEEIPEHSYGVLETIPIPKNILTVYISFSKKDKLNYNIQLLAQKYFDGYSHLGFLIVDIPKMKTIIEAEYGNKQLDLVYEFSNTEIIDQLFKAEIIALTWGINPFTFPMYSTNNIKALQPLLGKKFKDEGLFNITENIESFSIIPGFDLKDWHSILKKDYPKIKIYGKGKKVHLSPYALTDSDGTITTTSFAIYRSEKKLTEAKPLLNIDLLYDKSLID
ncbi:MAG: hypothetical protein ACSHWV_10535 [Cellulophaga fucicola]